MKALPPQSIELKRQIEPNGSPSLRPFPSTTASRTADLNNSGSTARLFVQQADMSGPAVEDRQDLVALVGHQRDIDGIDPELPVALQLVEVVRRATEPQRQRFRVAPRFLRHLAERRDVILRLAAGGVRIPAVAIAHRTPRRPWEGTAEDDRRVRLLRRLRPGHHRVEIDD